MDQSMMRDLEELQRYARAFGSVLSSASQAAPVGARGADSTGRVTAGIDAEGRPTSVDIDERWSSDIAPEALGAAVLEAYQDAVSKHLGEWSEALERQGFGYQMRDFRAAAAAPANPFVVPSVPRSGRDLGQLAEELMRLLDTAHVRATSPTPDAAVEQRPAAGQVSVALANGQLASVHIDGPWAEEHSARAIAAEVMGAVARAQAESPSVAGPSESRGDPLLDDADSVLSDVLHRLTPPTTTGA